MLKKKIYLFIKRCIDIIFSLICIIILSPVFLIISIVIKIESKGPIIFKQERIGEHGKTFKIYKFRTMQENAEKLIENFSEKEKKEFNENYKLQNDFRVTKFGKTLRRSKLDELPQFVNILKGDMSLVGPRPVVKKEVLKYKNNKDKFLSIKPGMTGYWQAYATEGIKYEERMKMELYYVDNCGFKLDLKIFIKTISLFFKKKRYE